MDMNEMARFIIWLRAKGISDKDIDDLLLYMANGEEKYLPHSDNAE